MAVTVDTSTVTGAIYSDAFAVTANGVKWFAYDNGTTIELSYDSGSGWTSHGTVGTSGEQACLFIDEDDYAHLVFIQSSQVHYHRGTPTDGTRTDWTWDGPYTMTGEDTEHAPRVVAHSEGTGWKAHVIFGAKDADPWTTGTWWYRRKCDHPSGGHAHLHTRTCGGWTTGTPAGCAGFGTHSHSSSDNTCGPSCEAWPNNGNPLNCGYTLLTGHNHGVTDAGTDSYYQQTGSGTDYYNRVYYGRFDITSSHVITTDQSPQALSNTQSNYNESHPFIDFAHTGDGKTPKASPHIFVGWQNQSNETYYQRLPYSAGWSTWDTIDLISSGQSHGYAVGGFNGTDFVIAHRDQTSGDLIKAWRVSEDGATVTAYPTVPDLAGNLASASIALVGDSIYLFASDGTDGDIKLAVYDGSWSSWENLQAASSTSQPFRHNMAANKHPDGTIDVFYLEGAGSPYDLDTLEYEYSGVGGGGWGFIPIGG